MTLRLHIVALTALLMALFVAGCTADRRGKLGADGEVCFADNDCQEGLICIDELCTPNGDAGGNNSEDFNRRAICEDTCSHIRECLDNVETDCAEDCTDDTTRWRNEAFLTVMNCVQGMTCQELRTQNFDVCLGGISIPQERETFCEELGTQGQRLCMDGEFFHGMCRTQGKTLNDEIFFEAEECLNRSTCRNLEDCIREAWDLF